MAPEPSPRESNFPAKEKAADTLASDVAMADGIARQTSAALLCETLDPAMPVLLAGPTASGKSGLAMEIAEKQGRAIVNADALQVFSDWRILTARPGQEDEARVTHHLYGHVPGTHPYSVGTWLRDVRPLLHQTPAPVIVGGTGLYFAALTQGLASIPETPPDIRQMADAYLTSGRLNEMIDALDSATRGRIDLSNPARVQRAWEVLKSTGRGLSEWQDNTPPPPLSPNDAHSLVIEAPKDWLTPRIERRLRQMLDKGVLEEAERNLPFYAPAHPSSKAIGATEFIAHLRGEMNLDAVLETIAIRTRQYAKRQRTWFRARMSDWTWLDGPTLQGTPMGRGIMSDPAETQRGLSKPAGKTSRLDAPDRL